MFQYLGIEISTQGDVEADVRQQTAKATRIAACLNHIIRRNKHMGVKAKSRM